jgi:hypothetical protein
MVRQNSKGMLPISNHGSSMSTADAISFDEEQHTKLFLKDQNPKSVVPSIANFFVCHEWNLTGKELPVCALVK